MVFWPAVVNAIGWSGGPMCHLWRPEDCHILHQSQKSAGRWGGDMGVGQGSGAGVVLRDSAVQQARRREVRRVDKSIETLL